MATGMPNLVPANILILLRYLFDSRRRLQAGFAARASSAGRNAL